MGIVHGLSKSRNKPEDEFVSGVPDYSFLCGMHEERLIARVEELIGNYQFKEPFSRYLKNYFSAHRNMGARDRRESREWSFNYFRTGRSLDGYSFREKLIASNFLCSRQLYPSLEYLLRDYPVLSGEALLGGSVEERISQLKSVFPDFREDRIFPFPDHLSEKLDKIQFNRSFLVQPEVWIRVRSRNREDVKQELTEHGIAFKEHPDSPNAFSFENSTALDSLRGFEKGWFEIQDINSQKTAAYYKPAAHEHWWDACAASGGKSLLLKELEPSVDLLATDNRDSILQNLRLRMARSGVGGFKVETRDLLHEPTWNTSERFDGILADVPCSGSGTWSRTPESMTGFDPETISKHFVPLQRKIVSNLAVSLKKGKPLIYMTCSVFKEENESNIEYFVKKLRFSLESFSYLQGAGMKADTLFVARLLRTP